MEMIALALLPCARISTVQKTWNDVSAPTCANAAHYQFSGQSIFVLRYLVRVS